MPKRNHNPERTCIGCNQRDVKNVMIRIAKLGEIFVPDPLQRLGGRGGYLHHRDACLGLFARRSLKEWRSFRCKIAPAERKRIIDLICSAAG